MTLGIALRIGDYSPAAMISSVPAAPVAGNGPVIEAQAVRESGAAGTRCSLAGRSMHSGMRGTAYFRDHAPTYTRHGGAGQPSENSGLLLDLFG